MFNKFDNFFMEVAESTSKLSYAKRLQVGAVLVRDRRILATGYNGTPTGYHTNICEAADNTTLAAVVHAEENLICHMAKSTESSVDSTLYVTHAPCEKCSKLIAQAGIKRVIYGKYYPTSDPGIKLLTSLSIAVEQYEAVPNVDLQR